MKIYLASLGAGILVGVVYSLINVRSPAPPIVALIGLLGMLIGEQIVPVGRHVMDGVTLSQAWHRARSSTHLFGLLPGRHAEEQTAKVETTEARS